MKYIISESRVFDFMRSYLDTFADTKAVSEPNPFIVIAQPSQGDDEQWDDYMEYDHTDGRLWINKSFLSQFCDIFGLNNQEARTFISDWFESRFEVKINFVD